MEEKSREIIKSLEQYSSSNIAICLEDAREFLKMYRPRTDKWYTNSRLSVRFPEFGSRAGYAVTMRVGVPGEKANGQSRDDLLRLIDASPKPVTLVIQVDEPEELRYTDSNFGGLFGKKCHILGVENVICDGAIRDLDELKELGMQVMIPGTVTGTAPSVIYELNGEVEVEGMKVRPGDIVHMDSDGAVKFPAEKAEEVLRAAQQLDEKEKEKSQRLDQAKTLEDCLSI